MELNDTNAKKAYETVVEVLKGMDNVEIFHRDGENIFGNIYNSPEQNARMFFMTISQESKSIKLTIRIKDSISDDHYMETLFAINYANNFLPKGHFMISIADKALEFKMSHRYNFKGWEGENIDTVLYMIEKAQTASMLYGDRLVKIANGELSLDNFWS